MHMDSSMETSMHILLIEDEPQVASFVNQALADSGYTCSLAGTSEEGRAKWEGEEPDLVVLDLMLPDGDGLALLQELRDKGIVTPVLILTAKSGMGDRVSGLDAGADDYLIKPFGLEEFLARVRALLRRSTPTTLKVGDLELDFRQRRVRRANRVIFLSPTEYALMEILATHPREPVSKAQILEFVWDDPLRDPNSVEVYVKYLRSKLERGDATRLIHTVRGKGYLLSEEAPD